MKELRWLREQGEMMNSQDRALLPHLSIAESTEIFAMLYDLARPQLDATESLYRPERIKYLSDLQRRLRRFARWERKRERTVRKRRPTPKASR